MKKKLLTLLFAGCMVLSMTACGGKTTEGETENTTQEETTTVSDEPTSEDESVTVENETTTEKETTTKVLLIHLMKSQLQMKM